MRSRIGWWLLGPGLLVWLVACGGRGAADPTVIPVPTGDNGGAIATSVQQTVAAIAVAQTVAALTTSQPAPTAAATPADTAAAPSPTPAAPPTVADTPLGVCRVLSGVNLRAGPGVAYDPPLGSLGVNTQLTPLGYVAEGFPQGPWLQAQVQVTGQVGWVSAMPQYVTCDFDLATLPAASFPPTPPPPTAPPPPLAPTATRPLASAPDIDNDAPGGSFPTTDVTGNVLVDPAYLFRMDVRDLTVGDFEGAGINFVVFDISGNGVDYSRQENNAGYCVFGGGEPACNPWPTDDLGRYTWGEGGPVVESGEYFASITVFAERSDPEFGGVWNWNFAFRVTLP